jgi:hypothetical protein
MNFARPSDVNFCTAQEETLLTHRANINRLLERAGILLSHFPHFEEGPIRPEFHKLAEDGLALIDAGGRAVVDERAKKQFFAFSRTVYGQVRSARTANGCWFTRTVARPTSRRPTHTGWTTPRANPCRSGSVKREERPQKRPIRHLAELG